MCLDGPQPHRPICSLTVPVWSLQARPNAPVVVEERSRREEHPSNTPTAPSRPRRPHSGFLSVLRTTCLALTLALVFLLLISIVVNVSLLLGSRAERSRHLDGSYVYHPLQEMNGELSAAEKEQPGETCNPFKD